VGSSGHFTTLLSQSACRSATLVDTLYNSGSMKTRADARLLIAAAVTAFLAASVYSGIGAGLEAYGPVPYLSYVC
jgi:hypothetical protein